MAQDSKKFDLQALRVAGEKAQEEIASWPLWKQQAAAASFVSRRSGEREPEQWVEPASK